MTTNIKLLTAGTDTGPFDLYSDVDGFSTPFQTGVSLTVLMASQGYTTSLTPNGAITIRVQSTGLCTNYIDIVIDAPVTTTTTTIATAANAYCYAIEIDTNSSDPNGNLYLVYTEAGNLENNKTAVLWGGMTKYDPSASGFELSFLCSAQQAGRGISFKYGINGAIVSDTINVGAQVSNPGSQCTGTASCVAGETVATTTTTSTSAPSTNDDKVWTMAMDSQTSQPSNDYMQVEAVLHDGTVKSFTVIEDETVTFCGTITSVTYLTGYSGPVASNMQGDNGSIQEGIACTNAYRNPVILDGSTTPDGACDLQSSDYTNYYVANGEQFSTATILYSASSGTGLAPAGYYREKNFTLVRQWNGVDTLGAAVQCAATDCQIWEVKCLSSAPANSSVTLTANSCSGDSIDIVLSPGQSQTFCTSVDQILTFETNGSPATIEDGYIDSSGSLDAINEECGTGV